MKRNDIGMPLPASFEEITRALNEVNLPIDDAAAEIFYSEENDPLFSGWWAVIADIDNGDPFVCTLGWADKAVLIEGLKALGISSITTED